MMRSIISFLLAVYAASNVAAFQVSPVNHPSSQHSSSSSTTSLNVFGNALKNAFSNDETLGKAKNAGLSNGPEINDQVTVNGKAVKGAVVGQKLTAVAMKARVKVCKHDFLFFSVNQFSSLKQPIMSNH
jgi:hypothetical protein